MSTESTANAETKKSGDSRSDRRWKPSSLNPFVLASVISFTLFLVVTLAILQAKSNQDGGILFSESIDTFPAGMAFLYLYLPTIIAVFYTTIWNWIDLDIKRLEPWYQLSKESGAPASESILLQYPVEFLATVPISSMKRRFVIRAAPPSSTNLTLRQAMAGFLQLYCLGTSFLGRDASPKWYLRRYSCPKVSKCPYYIFRGASSSRGTRGEANSQLHQHWI